MSPVAAGQGVAVVVSSAGPPVPIGSHTTPTRTTHGLDLASGADRWQAPGTIGIDSVRPGTVLVENEPQLEARATTDGTVRWMLTNEPLASMTDQLRVHFGPPSDTVITKAKTASETSTFNVRDLATGKVLWSRDGRVRAAGAQRLVWEDGQGYALPALLDARSGRHLAEIAVPCIQDAACSLPNSYIQNIAIDDAVTIVVVNDFNGG
jgi:hypothetical protein